MSNAATNALVASTVSRVKTCFPGVVVAGLVAMAAQFVAEHSQAPAMLMALLMGMAINFLGEETSAARPGLDFSAKGILKLGIVLLGVRISSGLVLDLGWQTLVVLMCALCLTIGFGLVVGRWLGQTARFSVLTAGAVSICGASAALAISSVLPRDDQSEKRLFLTVVGVTALSTVAMILYPALLAQFGVSDSLSGKVLGATIHDVAQVIGAGYSVSDPAGDTAALVKLVRVTLLAPTVVLIALWFRLAHSRDGAVGDQTSKPAPMVAPPGTATTRSAAPPVVPVFVLGFVAIAVLNSVGLVPAFVRDPLSMISKSCLLIAIAGVGVRTNLRELTSVGYAPIVLMVLETAFIAGVSVGGFALFAAA